MSHAGPWLPREHGGWVMLYAPLLVGIARGGVFRADLLAVIAAVTAAYFARVPAIAILTRRPRADHAARWLIVCLLAGGASAAWLAWHPHRMALLGVGSTGAALFGVYAVLSLRREERTAAGELAGVAGLVLSAPFGYTAAMGERVLEAAGLWAVNLLFFGSSVFYVKWRVRTIVAGRRGPSTTAAARDAAVALVAYHLVATASLAALAWAGLVPWAILWAFSPLLLRYLLPLVVGRTPTVPQVGIAEVIVSAVFVAILLGVY